MKKTTRALSILPLLFMVSCQITLLERAPLGETKNCADYVGTWLAVEDDGSLNQEGKFVIDEQCHAVMIEESDDGSHRETKFSFSHLQIESREYFLVRFDDLLKLLNEQASSGSGIDFLPENLAVYRVSRSKNQLQLLGPDHRFIARQIFAGEMDGETYWKGKDSGENLLHGDAAQISKQIGTKNFFQIGKPMRFQLAPDSSGLRQLPNNPKKLGDYSKEDGREQ